MGNFEPVFSTESHHKWTWEHMGHQVTALQANKTTTDQVLAACRGSQLLEVTYTHGWPFPGKISPDDLLKQVQRWEYPLLATI